MCTLRLDIAFWRNIEGHGGAHSLSGSYVSKGESRERTWFKSYKRTEKNDHLLEVIINIVTPTTNFICKTYLLKFCWLSEMYSPCDISCTLAVKNQNIESNSTPNTI